MGKRKSYLCFSVSDCIDMVAAVFAKDAVRVFD